MKDFVVINFGEYFKCTREKLYAKLSENKILEKLLNHFISITTDKVRKYVEMMKLSSFDNCICHYNIKIVNVFYPELQLLNNKPTIKNKLKEFLSELKV